MSDDEKKMSDDSNLLLYPNYKKINVFICLLEYNHVKYNQNDCKLIDHVFFKGYDTDYTLLYFANRRYLINLKKAHPFH